MIAVFISIITIYSAAIAYNLTIGRPKLCPICTAVAGTWLWQLIVYFIDPEFINPLWLGILMGGSVVGILYQIDRKIAGRLSWVIIKPLWVAIGFGMVSAIIREQWPWVILAGISLVIMGVIIIMTMFSSQKTTSTVLERLKNCC